MVTYTSEETALYQALQAWRILLADLDLIPTGRYGAACKIHGKVIIAYRRATTTNPYRPATPEKGTKTVK